MFEQIEMKTESENLGWILIAIINAQEYRLFFSRLITSFFFNLISIIYKTNEKKKKMWGPAAIVKTPTGTAIQCWTKLPTDAQLLVLIQYFTSLAPYVSGMQC